MHVLYNTGEEAKPMTGRGGGLGGTGQSEPDEPFRIYFFWHILFRYIFQRSTIMLCKVVSVFDLSSSSSSVELSRRRDSEGQRRWRETWSIGSEKRRGGRERRPIIYARNATENERSRTNEMQARQLHLQSEALVRASLIRFLYYLIFKKRISFRFTWLILVFDYFITKRIGESWEKEKS